MSLPVSELKGISDAVLNVFEAQGLTNSDALLAAAKTPAGRKQLASVAGVDASVILALANRADLARISGIGSVYSDLLEEAGVDTVKELAHRSPENLHAKVNEINQVRQLTPRPPSLDQIASFVNTAKELPAGLEY
ncbi:DUF4332 domain-containing protein [Larkinella insperata]|uniref:DUF4332 domain-containing protein n=1 Tax=Larkinella insperata TaxID=332158 RepID=A0ABW3QDZ3_9BACT|nr:DUF4332 domain-containing protein [Larkinella insperata]